MGLKDDLIAAKALIDSPATWGRGYFRTDDGCYCAAGAVIYAARPIGGRDFGREDAGIRALKAALPKGVKGIAQFITEMTRRGRTSSPNSTGAPTTNGSVECSNSTTPTSSFPPAPTTSSDPSTSDSEPSAAAEEMTPAST